MLSFLLAVAIVVVIVVPSVREKAIDLGKKLVEVVKGFFNKS